MFLKMQVAIIIWYLAVIYILNLEGNASLLSITFLAQQPLNSVLWVWVVMAIFFFPLKRGEEKKMEMIKIKNTNHSFVLISRLDMQENTSVNLRVGQ